MARSMTGRWGNRNIKDLVFQIGFDFVAQLEDIMEDKGIGRTKLAETLGVTKGRVSQILNDPGNLELENIVKYARALNRKVAIVAYDDGDPNNDKGPVSPQIFTTCWEKAGRPTDFFSAGMTVATTNTVEIDPQKWGDRPVRVSSDDLEAELEVLNITVWQKVEDRGLHAGTNPN
jgi:transcriptional regulator with XRE-family HTH domain